MLTYLQIFRITISEFFVYRLNFVLWRVRNLLTLLIKYYLWIAVFEQSNLVFGYTEQQMLTYILISNIFADIALSTKTGDIAGEILKGDIINYILKPLAFFKYHAARDLADKFLNIFFSIAEVALIITLLKPSIFVQTNASILAWTAVFIVIGCIISFFVNMCLSFIAFWSNEVWAPRFIFYMLMLIFAGSFFPLDVVPRAMYYAFFLTPFPYLYFLPTRVYLGVPGSELIFFLIGGLGWCVLSFLFTRYIWKRGLHEFSFFGK